MTLIYSENFDTNFAGVHQLQSMGTVVAGSAAPNGIAGRLEIVNGVLKSTIVDTDSPTAGGVRSECVFAASALGDEDWIAFEMKIRQADWDDNGTISICQVHNKDTIPAAVPLLLVVKHNAWQVLTPQSIPPAEGQNFQRSIDSAFEFDRWNEVVIHTKWMNNSTGFMELYVNGEAIYKRFDVGTAYNGDAPYFKLGVYDTPHTLGFGTKTAYFRNLKLYRGLESQSVILGSPPRPKRRRTA